MCRKCSEHLITVIFLYSKMPYYFLIGFGSVGFGEYWKMIIIGPQCLQSVIIIPIIGPQCPFSVNLKSSSMSCGTLRGFCPGKIRISGILEHTHFQKVCISSFWITFPKMAPQGKPLCSETRSEILCRTPVSILRDLSPRLQNPGKTSEYSFLAWMSMFSWVIGVIWDLA